MKYLLLSVIILICFKDYKCADITAKMKKLLSKSVTDRKGIFLRFHVELLWEIFLKMILHISGGVTVLTYGTKSNPKQIETFHTYLEHFGLSSKVSTLLEFWKKYIVIFSFFFLGTYSM